MKSLPNVKLGQVIIGSNLVLSTLIWPQDNIFVHIKPYLPIFTYVWLYLGLITLIWACLPLIPLILPYVPYVSPTVTSCGPPRDYTNRGVGRNWWPWYHPINVFFYWGCTSVQMFRAIVPFLMEILHLKMWGIQVSSANAVWVLI